MVSVSFPVIWTLSEQWLLITWNIFEKSQLWMEYFVSYSNWYLSIKTLQLWHVGFLIETSYYLSWAEWVFLWCGQWYLFLCLILFDLKCLCLAHDHQFKAFTKALGVMFQGLEQCVLQYLWRISPEECQILLVHWVSKYFSLKINNEIPLTTAFASHNLPVGGSKVWPWNHKYYEFSIYNHTVHSKPLT